MALYGFKGGAGRSTAAFMLAQHLAAQGRCVLAIDLDLESPGLGALLQSSEELPEFGLIDYLAESAVGNEEGLVRTWMFRLRTRKAARVGWPAGWKQRCAVVSSR